MFSIGAFVVIFDEQEKVLLSHRRDKDIWNLPGGGVESGELPNEAAIREVSEETGLDVDIESLVGVYGKLDRDELVFTFLGKVVGGELIQTEEADDWQYFSLEELPANTMPKHVERIQDAARHDAPVFRIQTAQSDRSWR